MQTARTIRNCLPVFRAVCPQQWDALAPTEDPGIRHCGGCDQRVYFCETDAETQAHARAGHCIAREMPDSSEVRAVYLGLARELPPETPEQAEAGRRRHRERGIDDAIKNTGRSSRSCPGCHYPAPDWRVACRVCGYEFGRVAPSGSPIAESGR